MANFSFLEGQKNYKMFASAAIEAEKVYTSSPAMCAIGCRKALELAVKWVYAVDKTIDMPYRDNLQSLIHEPSFKDALGEDTWKKLPYIIKLGNLAVHTGKNVSPQEGIFSLKGYLSLFNGLITVTETNMRNVLLTNKMFLVSMLSWILKKLKSKKAWL